MSRIAPKPIIARVAQTWDVPPGMKIALVEDVEKRVWIVESCPAGTHFWTLEQTHSLPQSGRTGHALRAAVAAGYALLSAREQAAVTVTPQIPVAPVTPVSPVMPAYREERHPLAGRRNVVRPLRQATRREKVALCA